MKTKIYSTRSQNVKEYKGKCKGYKEDRLFQFNSKWIKDDATTCSQNIKKEEFSIKFRKFISLSKILSGSQTFNILAHVTINIPPVQYI